MTMPGKEQRTRGAMGTRRRRKPVAASGWLSEAEQLRRWPEMTWPKCPQCGQPVHNRETKCPACGAEMPLPF